MKKPQRLIPGLHTGFTLPGHAWRILHHTEADDYQEPEDIIQFNRPGRVGLVRLPETRHPFIPCFSPRKKAAIQAWTDGEARAGWQRFHSDMDALDEFFVRAETDPEAQHALGQKAERILVLLMDLAEQGNRAAINSLVRLTATGCQRLRQIRESKPEILEPTARYMEQWPVLMSTKPQLCDKWPFPGRISGPNSAPDKKKYLETCRAMNLGGATNRNLDRYSKWKPDAAAEIANRLVEFIKLRQHRLKHPVEPYSDLGDPIAERVSGLGPFTKETAEAWWAVAEELLLHAYPEPQKIPELAGLINPKKSPNTIPGKKSAPTKKVYRSRILEEIEDRFKSMAPI